ncbi:MAG TPA: GNAT family N-acetyltransferase [Clostridia bacterium]|nr:GNAT family N-acetyltransferase [Clostridia bacterium]
MIIRKETPRDFEEIIKLTYEAFTTLDFEGRQKIDEHYLVYLMKESEYVVRDLCLVAEKDGKIVGHILYARSKVVQSDGSEKEIITFGPLSVMPEYQRQGIGAALIKESLKAAREMGFGAVLIIGVPDYYPRLGFKRAREWGLTVFGTSPDEFMAYELISGYLTGGGELILCAPEYEMAETDKEGYKKFHEEFMRKYYSNSVALRPVYDADVNLIAEWLQKPHVAKWYGDTDGWLAEIKARRHEFSFIRHFIAEVEGKPIGFCQYYDCFIGQKYEDWYKAGAEKDAYSIDYLIGDESCLGKGLGKEILRRLEEKIRNLGAKRIIVNPERDNDASRGALMSNGYVEKAECFEKVL